MAPILLRHCEASVSKYRIIVVTYGDNGNPPDEYNETPDEDRADIDTGKTPDGDEEGVGDNEKQYNEGKTVDDEVQRDDEGKTVDDGIRAVDGSEVRATDGSEVSAVDGCEVVRGEIEELDKVPFLPATSGRRF